MTSIFGFSLLLMGIGVALSACDNTQPSSSSTHATGVPLQRLTFAIAPLPGADAVTQSQLDDTVSIIQKRLDVMQVGSATPEVEGKGTLVVTVPADARLDELISILTQRGFIEFLSTSSNPPEIGVYIMTEPGSPAPEASPHDKSGAIYTVVISSDDIEIGSATVNIQAGRPDLQINLNSVGKKKLADYTRGSSGSFMPVTLDKIVLFSPMIHGEIASGSLGIAGLQEVELKKTLSAANSGVLPVLLTFGRSEMVAPK